MKIRHLFCASLICIGTQTVMATFPMDDIAVIGATPQGLEIANALQYNCRTVHLLHDKALDFQLFPSVTMEHPDALYNQDIDLASYVVHSSDWRTHSLLNKLNLPTEAIYLYQEEGHIAKRLQETFALNTYRELAISFITLRPLGLLRNLFEPAPSLGAYLRNFRAPSIEAHIQALAFTRNHGDLASLPVQARSMIPDLTPTQPFFNQYYQDLFTWSNPTYTIPAKGYRHFLNTYLTKLDHSGTQVFDLSLPQKSPYVLNRVHVQVGTGMKQKWQISKPGLSTPLTVDRVILAVPGVTEVVLNMAQLPSTSARKLGQVLTDLKRSTHLAQLEMNILSLPTPHDHHTVTFHKRLDQAQDIHGPFGSATKQIAHTTYTVKAPILFPDPHASAQPNASETAAVRKVTWNRPYINPQDHASLRAALTSIQGEAGLYFLPQIFSSTVIEGALEDADKLYNDYFRDPEEKIMSMIR